MSPSKKRSTNRINQAFGQSDHPLGARQASSTPPVSGGGYQDGCTSSDFAVPRRARDARLDELRRSGVGRVWLQVAEAIGYESFLVVWRTLSEQPEVADERHRVYVPRWQSFLRYQRNLLVRTLARAGASPEEIQTIVAREVGETMSRTHVCRLVKAADNEA